jgi:ABC-2 type transport system ATP-binding protein
VEQHNHTYELILERDTSPQAILRQLVEADVVVERFEVATPPLEEIFISVVEGAQ